VIASGPPFGRFQTILVENDVLCVVACPALGGRILSLVDRRSGREWLVQGEPPAAPGAWAREDALFGGREAFGWDECLPTIAPCPDPLDPAAPTLRDHGEQWGRPADVTANGNVLVTHWSSSRWGYTFRRRLRLDRSRLVASYQLGNPSAVPMPFLWSIHPLLRLEPGARVWLKWVDTARVGGYSGFPQAPDPQRDAWGIGDISAGTAMKVYARLRAPATAEARQPDRSTLRVEWDQAVAPVVGLWLDFGGWPAIEPIQQVAIEPTTSEDDDVASAIGAGRAPVLAPGETLRWSVRLTLS
jgi:galactose mutarotase-like enzyme